ncbi:MAG TPA: tetraacyldisaccharide 4'-kinase [Patescibacteria group bacterium]|nr:tetraacyldisaccharide 4'-kinase [Patescibacteria group bacterium]
MQKIKDYLHNLATDRYRGPVAGLLKVFLLFLSFLYGAIVWLLVAWSRLRTRRLPCKVISVGNITVGGTGKTTLVQYLAGYLQGQGHKVAILSRGYKRCRNRRHQAEDCATLGDEPFMLRMNLRDVPVVVGADRIRSGLLAVSEYAADTVILDDGFQQWRLAKDLEVATIDAQAPFGNTHLLPRGILRQPLSDLRRADVFVLTKTDLAGDTAALVRQLRLINPGALVVLSRHAPIALRRLCGADDPVPLETLRAKAVACVCGIADPDSFEKLVLGLGARIGLSLRFPDHYAYRACDIERIMRQAQEKGIDTVVTTEKDAVRLSGKVPPAPGAVHFLALRIGLKIIADEQEFNRRLLGIYAR